MGYFIKEIARESKSPAKVSLSGNPNFIEFEAYTAGQSSKVDISLQILNPHVEASKTTIKITEKKGETTHEFKGTAIPSDVNNTTFYLNRDNRGITAENLKNCLLANSFLRSNFEITILPDGSRAGFENGDTIRIVSKGAGPQYAFKIEFDSSFLKRTGGNPENTFSSDTIDRGNGNYNIELEMYRNTGIFNGVDDFLRDELSMGTLVTTLTKSYSGAPLWFDVNTLAANNRIFAADFLYADGWCPAGTLSDYRFIARRSDGINHESFYISDVYYTLTGYMRTLENNDLSEYVYNTRENNIIRPLTRQPVLTHIKGQSQYFNFILADPRRNETLDEEFELGILFKLYSQSKKYLGSKLMHTQRSRLFDMVNTVRLNIDEAVDGNNAGIVEACLYRSGKEISRPLTFNILPGYLYAVNDFAFLNPLGGWSSFNFSGTEQTDFKAASNTIYKTQMPAYKRSSEIESVYSKEVSEQFAVQTMPLKREIADWLKEMSASPAVYELRSGRYVVVDEMNIKHNSTDDLFRIEMKYHYSDSFNAQIK